jgi:hypothetical protein
MDDGLAGPGRTLAERRSGRRYVLEFSAAAAGFLLFAVIGSRLDIQDANIRMAVVVVLPVAAVLGMAIAAARFVARMDERQRQTVLAAAAVAGLVTVVVTMALGLMQENRLISLDLTAVLPIFALFLGISIAFVRRKYE